MTTVREGDKGVLLVVEAEDLVRELNIAMTWLSYPGRTNGTATAEALDFSAPGGAHR
jgi:hypothetical protein